MGFDLKEFIEQYIYEAEEHISTIESNLIKLKKDPKNEDILNSTMRALHTLKGSSRMLKFYKIEKLTHLLESFYKRYKEGMFELTDDAFSVSLITIEYIKKLIENIKNYKEEKEDIKEIENILKEAIDGNFLPAKSLKSKKIEKTKQEEVKIQEPEVIKVKIKDIENIVSSIDDIIIKKIHSTRYIDKMQNIIPKINDANLVKELSILKNSFLDISTQIEDSLWTLRNKLYNLSMLPLSFIFEPIKKNLEELSVLMNKDINIEIKGSNIKIDRNILNVLYEVILHLARNAIDHGIELPEERIKLRKKEKGTIKIIASQDGKNIKLTIKDDGKGIDYEAIRKKAMELYPADKDRIEKMSEEDLTHFIFEAGFSSKEKEGMISGRGIGLDVVKEKIENMKGKVEIKSQKGEGTEVIITIPTSLTVIEGYFIKEGEQKLFLPITFIKSVFTYDPKKLIEIGTKKGIDYQGKVIPVYSLSLLLKNKNQRPKFLFILEYLGESIGLGVENIIEYSKNIYKPVPRIFENQKLVHGIVLDEVFNPIPILHIPELIHRFRNLSDFEYISQKESQKKVLIVEDSPLVMDMIKNIIKDMGYITYEARDGIEALDILKTKLPNIIITDLIMPRMDGYTLIDNLKRMKETKNIPIIVITSEDKEEKLSKIENKVNTIIHKSNFDRNVLKNIISRVER